MSKSALPCIRCDKPLDNVFEGSINQPSEGTAFTTGGHYGSTVFDPMDGTEIEISVCDECLKEWGRKGNVLASQRQRRIVVGNVQVGIEYLDRGEYTWDPDKEYDSEDELSIDYENVGNIPNTRIYWRQLTASEQTYLAVKAEEEG